MGGSCLKKYGIETLEFTSADKIKRDFLKWFAQQKYIDFKDERVQPSNI